MHGYPLGLGLVVEDKLSEFSWILGNNYEILNRARLSGKDYYKTEL